MRTDNVHLLIEKSSDEATLSGGSWRVAAPLSNIQTQDVREVARSTNATTGSTQWRVDAGSSPPASWSMVALLAHNMSTTARWRVVFTNSSTDDVPSRLYDSGWIVVWEPTVTFGSRPWGTFPWDGVDTRDYPNHPVAFHLAPDAVIARYVFIYIDDTSNPDGYVDIGRFLAGEAWSPAVNVDYGLSVRWVDPSDVRRTEGGRRIVRERAKYRVAEMQFSWLTAAEAWGVVFEWQRLGKSNDILFVACPNDPADIRFKRTFYGALVDPQPIGEESFRVLGCRAAVEEIE